MNYEFKIATVYFPDTGKTRDIMFHKEDLDAVATLCVYVLENNGVVVEVESYEDWEIEILANTKTAAGEPLFQPRYSPKDGKPGQ